MDLPYFERTTRRAFMRRGLSASAVVAAGGLLAACSKDDKTALASSPSTSSASSSTASSARSSSSSASSSSSSTPSTATSSGSGSGGATTPTPAVVTFTYKASDSGGRVKNPFVAVWLEDDSGELAALLGVVYLEREGKYLRELTSYAKAAADVTTRQLDAVTGATRSAGEYRFQWDGSGLDGTPLTGAHTLWIEASREHGPHSVTSGVVELGSAGPTTIPANGELSKATITVG